MLADAAIADDPDDAGGTLLWTLALAGAAYAGGYTSEAYEPHKL